MHKANTPRINQHLIKDTLSNILNFLSLLHSTIATECESVHYNPLKPLASNALSPTQHLAFVKVETTV